MSSSPLRELKGEGAVAVKTILKVKKAAPARAFPQLLVCENAVPLIAMEDKYKGASPRLVNVTVCGTPGVPTIWPVNASDETEREPRANESVQEDPRPGRHMHRISLVLIARKTRTASR